MVNGWDSGRRSWYQHVSFLPSQLHELPVELKRPHVSQREQVRRKQLFKVWKMKNAVFSYKARGWRPSGCGFETQPRGRLSLESLRSGAQSEAEELPRGQKAVPELIPTPRQWFNFAVKCCQKQSSVLFTFACQHDNRGLHDSHVRNVLARIPQGAGGGEVTQGPQWSGPYERGNPSRRRPRRWKGLCGGQKPPAPLGIYGYAMWGILCYAHVVLAEHQSFTISRAPHNG